MLRTYADHACHLIVPRPLLQQYAARKLAPRFNVFEFFLIHSRFFFLEQQSPRADPNPHDANSLVGHVMW